MQQQQSTLSSEARLTVHRQKDISVVQKGYTLQTLQVSLADKKAGSLLLNEMHNFNCTSVVLGTNVGKEYTEMCHGVQPLRPLLNNQGSKHS